MKITGLKFGGIGRFREDVEVPIAELGGAELVACVGPNGAGKSTLLEMIPGCLYRTTPSRGPLAGMANRKDSWAELQVELSGDRYTLKLLIDGVARSPRTEAYVLDGKGQPLTSGKVKDFAAEVAKKFPSAEVFFSSAFAAQTKEGSFLSLPPARRKALFADLLGLGHLQAMSDTAGEHARSVEGELSGLRARAETLAESSARVEDLRAKLAESKAALERAETEGKEAREAQEAYSKAWREWQERLTALQRDVDKAEHVKAAACEKRTAAEEDAIKVGTRISDLAGTMAALQARLSKRDDLEAADELAFKAESRIPALEEQLKEIDAHREKLREWERTEEMTKRAMKDAEQRVKDCRRDLDRSRRDAAALDDVPCGGEGKFSGCALIAHVTSARSSVPKWEAELKEAEADLAGAKEWLASLAPRPKGPSGDRHEIDRELQLCRRTISDAAKAREQLAGLREVNTRVEQLQQELAELRRAKGEAEERARVIEGKVKQADSDVDAARKRRIDHQHHEPKKPTADLEELRRKWGEASGLVSRLEAQIEEATKAGGQLAEVRKQIDTATEELDHWKHLQKALGREGVQALEIDAAGPEVSDLTNELLHACYGSRFSVSLETAALKADGKGTKEVFELRVIDSERGTEGSADQLSGGEKVLVSEALALAIAIYNARRSSVPLEDLFRDECAGALSSDNAVRYIEMLRKAIDLGGFHRCYFVAHQPELWDLADQRLLVGDGTVRLADAADIVLKPADTEESEAA